MAKVLGFVYDQRPDKTAGILSEAFPSCWGSTLISVTGQGSRKPPHRPEVSADTIRKELSAQRAQTGVLFLIDIREGDVAKLTETLVYRLPEVEVVTVRSGAGLSSTLRPHLEYFEILTSPAPSTMAEVLASFAARTKHAVAVLPRANRSAAAMKDFKEPQLVKYSMHQLKRVAVDWQKAKRRNHKKVHHSLMRCPIRDAMTALVADARFDISDSALRARAKRTWMCGDGIKRYFGWHLKWSLAGPRTTQNHCRVHYCSPTADSSYLYIGHCGAHLK